MAASYISSGTIYSPLVNDDISFCTDNFTAIVGLTEVSKPASSPAPKPLPSSNRPTPLEPSVKMEVNNEAVKSQINPNKIKKRYDWKITKPIARHSGMKDFNHFAATRCMALLQYHVKYHNRYYTKTINSLRAEYAFDDMTVHNMTEEYRDLFKSQRNISEARVAFIRNFWDSDHTYCTDIIGLEYRR